MESNNNFVEVPEIFDMDMHPDSGMRILFPQNGFVLAEKELLPLCTMCKQTPDSCDSPLARLMFVPKSMETSTPILSEGVSLKIIDGYAEGLLTVEQLKENGPLVCNWFEIKELG